jgi:ATP-binding cassette subfamily F protein uup
MPVVVLDRVAKRHAEKQVLAGVTLGVDDGDRVGVIGRNGSGKTTLLRLLAGAEEPDDGRVTYSGGARLSYVPQEPALDDAATALEAATAVVAGRVGDGARAAAAPAVAAAAAAVDEDTGRRVVAFLDRLGVADPQRRVGELSGGQRKRVALAGGLARDVDLLILDEPTNHLDVDAVEWLEQHLRARRGALLLVTHDRYLLDRLATRIVEVVDGALHTGYGTYADYLETRALREEQAARVEQKRRNRARTELEWLRRGPRARTSKARYRVDRAHELLASGPGPAAADMELGLPSRRLGTRVVDVLDAGKRYGDRWVLRHLTHRLAAGARIGVVGPNGAGKTTLLSLVAGRIAPDEGEVERGETVAVGWYGQDPEPLPPGQRVLDALQEVVLETRLADGERITAGELLERFGFPSQAQRGLVGELSGGERRRLELLRVLASAPNLLLMDEPTNDLDLDTLGVLEDELDRWRGAVVVASHDRYFLDRVCDDLFSVEPDGTIRHHPGGWTAWRDARDAEQRAARAAPADRRDDTRPRRPRRLAHRERQELAGLERRIPELETRRDQLTATLSSAPDNDALRAAGEELTRVLAELETAEARWLDLAELAEAG